LKEINPNLKTLLAVGGWAFNDPPTQNRFSNMVSTKESRTIFIESVVSLLGLHRFDGIDIDWEYPAADDRGGRPEDFVNYVLLL
jgi:chitinase